MQIQQVNRSDAERVWVNITNVDGKTITTHYPVYLMTNNKNTSSVGTNEAAQESNSCLNGEGSFIGLANEDIPNNDVGEVQDCNYALTRCHQLRGSRFLACCLNKLR